MATIRKRGNSYQIRVSEGYDSKGNQVSRTMTWKPAPDMTAKQIENELNKQAIMFEEQCTKGVIITNVKFEEFAERWLSEYATLNLKRSSLQRMKATTARIYPTFGHLKLNKITHRQIQFFVDNLSKNGKHLNSDKRLSRKSIVHHLNFLSDVFAYALRLEMITSNPCIGIVVPKGEKKEKAIYTTDEIKQLFRLLDEHGPQKYKVFVVLAIYGGFRNGELMGLEWKDIDFENCVVSIRRTSNYTVTDGLYTDTTKTKSSLRSLKLPQIVFDELEILRNEQLEQKSKVGSQWIESDRLFTTWNGSPMFRNTPYNWLRKFTVRHGMRFCDVHSLRHYNATALIHAGIDAATISGELGHSSVSTTTSTYCHAFREVQARTGETIAAVLNLS